MTAWWVVICEGIRSVGRGVSLLQGDFLQDSCHLTRASFALLDFYFHLLFDSTPFTCLLLVMFIVVETQLRSPTVTYYAATTRRPALLHRLSRLPSFGCLYGLVQGLTVASFVASRFVRSDAALNAKGANPLAIGLNGLLSNRLVALYRPATTPA